MYELVEGCQVSSPSASYREHSKVVCCQPWLFNVFMMHEQNYIYKRREGETTGVYISLPPQFRCYSAVDIVMSTEKRKM